MTLPFIIAPSQVDKKSPIDEQLMQAIKADLDYLDTQQMLMAGFDYQFKLNGRLNNLPTTKWYRLDGALIAKDQTFTQAKMTLKEAGNGGTMEADIRIYTKPNLPIISFLRKFTAGINSIARAGSSINTQSVTRSTAQIATQSITQWKSTLNIESIVPLGDDLFRYNLDAQPDSDWKVGDSIVISGCGSGGNNGTFTIVRVNDDNADNIIILNASGVEQNGSGGTVILAAFSYNYSNPVSTQFATAELGFFSGHADGGNNGSLMIYKINQSGNNIIVKNAVGVANGSAGGAADTNRWIYAFSSSAPSDYVVGENALMASHTAGGNNGSLRITNINFAGNNIVVYNSAGVVQGGVAGTVNTKRWIYYFSSDPSSGIIVSDTIQVTGANDDVNNGIFTVKQVNRSTSDNIVIYNNSGIAQGGAAGILVHTNMIVSFTADQSAVITIDSKILTYGTPSSAGDGNFQVLEVNRGGGSNYNVVIDAPDAVEAVGPCGRVAFESKSLFSTRPSFVVNDILTDFNNSHGRVSTNAVIEVTRATVSANTLLMMDLVSIPSGVPKDLTVQLL